MKRNLFPIALLALAASSCGSGEKQGPAKPDILAQNADTTVSPAQDFFDFANGGWIKANPIPADETSYGIAYLVDDELYNRKRKINEDAVKEHATSGIAQQIGDFWYSGMDTASIEANGIKPLEEELGKIAAISSKEELMQVAAEMHAYGVGVFFAEYVGQDDKNSEVMTYNLRQGGLGLPNRDYYFNTDERTVKIREAYPAYVTTMMTILGSDTATAGKKAKDIIALETKLAGKSRKLEDLRDPYKNYNKYAIASLDGLAPQLHLPQVIKAIGVHSIDSVIVGQPEFFTQLNEVIKTTDLAVLKDYMSYNLLRSFGSYLDSATVNAGFDFYAKTIRGAEQQRPRWKRVLDAEEGGIGEALGQLFAKEYFNEQAKKRYEDMVENVRSAYKARMQKLDWMSPATKEKALSKLAKITKKVGYPDKWKDFSSLKIDRGPFVLNMKRVNKWWNDYELNKLGKPVDREEWDMTPQTYNAYYNPSNNEIVLPAGIFTVPGYRDEELDDALVYGYAGASTIGHEITHGFDDEGRQFDENGNLHNWWTSEDEEQFTKRAQKLVDQFDKFVPVDSLHINGKQTLGENLADLGGLLIGLDAFKQTETYKKGETISGYTPLQRFFMGYALGWMYEVRKAQLANRIVTDVHSPAKYRVNGPFPNIPEFYEAFGVKPGDGMYLEDSLRVMLW